MTLRSLAYRVLCKVWELGLRARTRLIVGFPSDPTTILLANMTEAQQRAAASLAPQTAVLERARTERLTVIIPFRDRWSLTKACLDSLFAQDLKGYQGQILLVDNGSVEAETISGIEAVLKHAQTLNWRIEPIRLDEPFNFSRLNNKAVAHSATFRPGYLLFLNNDVELLGRDDVCSMMDFATTCPSLGALGCTLEYPDKRIQHLFLAPGVKIVGAHPFRGWRLRSDCSWFNGPRPVPAVTGAVLLVNRDRFAAVGGFDEDLAVMGQDLDLCLKLQKAGLVNWTMAQVRALHKEGATRGFKFPKSEVQRIYARWGDELLNNPFYSSRFSRFSETPVYGCKRPAYPWSKVLP